jgi:DNA-binding GntR family transcriptional regulator
MPSESGNGSDPRVNGHEGAAPGVRSLMKDRAYEEIKRGILRNDFPPGSFLAERQLAERLGMSKTPVKAALERLALEGFITVSPQQGIVIRELTVHEIADQYEIRAALESYILRTTAGRLTAEQVEQLQANLVAQERIIRSRDVHAAVAVDTEFHRLFAVFLGNQEILKLMASLRDRTQRLITKVFQLNPGRMASAHAEHVAIAEAVIAGDGNTAAKLIEAHLEKGKQLLLSPRRS